MARVLVVDDEKSIRLTLGAFIREDGHDVDEAEDVETALSLVRGKDFDVVVTDIMMPRMNGVDLLRKIKEISPDTQVVMITGEPAIDTAAEVVRIGAFDYLSKPIFGEGIKNVVGNAANVKTLKDVKHRLEKENRRYQEQLEVMVEEHTRALRKSEEKFRVMASSAQDAIVMSDDDGNITYWNSSAERIFGHRKDEIVGRISITQLIPERYHKIFTHGFRKFRNNGRESAMGKTFELWGTRKDGSEFPVEVSLSGVRIDDCWYSMGIIRDITDRKRAENLQTEEVIKRRNVIINTAHLLHTPLTVVKGNLELAIEGQKELSQELMQKLLTRLDEMKGLIERKLYENIDLLTVETTDGFTPARKKDI